MQWLEVERSAALVRRQYYLVSGGGGLDNKNAGTSKPYCVRCKTVGHKVADCKLDSTLSGLHHLDGTPAEDNVQACPISTQDQKYAEAESRAGTCPICRQKHTYNKPITKGSTETIPWPSSHLESCPQFSAMTPEQKGSKVEELKACP